MNTTQIREKIHNYVDQADDRLLTLINGMIEADQDKDWWGDLHPNLKTSLIGQSLSQKEAKDDLMKK